MSDPNLTAIIDTFVNQITAAVESAAAQRLQAAIAGAFGTPQKGRPGRPAKQAVAPVVAPKAAGRRVTPKVTRARKLQGQYLGALRALSAADKAKLRAVAKEKGVAAAVKMAAGMKKATG